MIYILRTDSGDKTYYKIGYTKREINKRITALQTGCPYKLELVKTMQGSQEKERELHGMLRHSRIHGEWYRDDFFVREALDIYDFKGFPHKEFVATEKQKQLIDFMAKAKHFESWPFGIFLKSLEISEDEIRMIPYGARNFDIGLLGHDTVNQSGSFHGEPYKGTLLCISKL